MKSRGEERPTSEHPVTVELIKLIEHQTIQALRDVDIATLDRTWAEEYTFTTPAGVLVPKAEYLAGLQARAFAYDILDIEGLTVRSYEETAIATGRARVKGRFGHQETHGIDHYQTVYVWQDARWQAVSTLATRVANLTDLRARRRTDVAGTRIALGVAGGRAADDAPPLLRRAAGGSR